MFTATHFKIFMLARTQAMRLLKLPNWFTVNDSRLFFNRSHL